MNNPNSNIDQNIFSRVLINSMNLKESKDENEDVEPGELLEDCWFFGNLLQTKSKSRMVRSFSDPCSSSNFPGKSYEETYESINTTPRRSNRTTKERRSNGKTSSSKNSLVRAPSLPTSLESEDFDDDEEMEFSMGKLIRQASLNYSDTRPPRKNAAKSVTASSSLTRQKWRRKAEIEELQGFKEKELSPNVERRMEEYEAKRGAKPYLSEAPPVPRWGGKRSTEDVKAQIKFWARAVASNVRQEC